MKIALVTTTINIPTVLKLYHRCNRDVAIFVACDKKTPDISGFLAGIDARMVWAGDPVWECSGLIGWNVIGRRNIAVLEALKWGADVIVTVDDDNIPLNSGYFAHIEYAFSGFNGLEVLPPDSVSWFDPGRLQFMRGAGRVVQRGFPMQFKRHHSSFSVTPVIDAPVGLVQGLVLGDPDTSAIDRLSQAPEVHQVSELARAGVVTDPRRTWAPLNSQNLAFRREFAPCFLMVPQFGRYDDIFAGLVAQWAMRPSGHCVKFGQPFVWQQRNAHDLLADLRAEAWGTEHIAGFAGWLDRLDYPAGDTAAAGAATTSVIDNLRYMVSRLPSYMTDECRALWLAWLKDCGWATA